MAVAITTRGPEYFLKPLDNGIRRPVTTLELTAIFKGNNPKWIGSVMADEYEMPDSLMAETLARGNDFTFATDQVIWEEDDNMFETASVKGAGAVTFAAGSGVTGTFTINAAAIPADTDDLDSSRITVPQWLMVKLGMEFTAFDTAGKKASGKITAIAGDLKTFTANAIGGTWNALGANVDVFFGGNNLDHCQQAPCVGYEKYKPKRNNTMKKDSECVPYCLETEIANGEDGVDSMIIFKNPNGEGHYNIDMRLENAQKLLMARAENDFAFSKRLTVSEANGGQVGTDGVMTIVEKRAIKNQGMIESIADVTNLCEQLRRNKIYKATIRCSNEQYTTLNSLFNANATLMFSPYDDKSNELYNIGFAGFKIGGVEVVFQRWNALDYMDSNIGKRYHYLVIPDKKLRRKMNGTTYDCNYLNIGFFGSRTKVWKFLRVDDHVGEGTMNFKTTYENKFVPIVFLPQHWIVGLTV